MSWKILICDDDPDILSALKRTLNGLDVTAVDTPADALNALKQDKFDAIVSDFSLGAEADGLDLLLNVKLMHPDMIRFLVTGNRDPEILQRAVNEATVHKYFFKPWNSEQLRTTLEIVLHGRRKEPS